MNWEAAGAIGEIIGAGAVVATLIYLAFQIKYAKQTAIDSITLERTKIVCDGMMAMATNDELRNSFDRVSGTFELSDSMAAKFDVSVEDAGRTHYITAHWFWLHWGQFTAAKSKQEIDELGELIRSMYSNPAILHVWQTSPYVKPLLDRSFVDFVDNQLANDPGEVENNA